MKRRTVECSTVIDGGPYQLHAFCSSFRSSVQQPQHSSNSTFAKNLFTHLWAAILRQLQQLILLQTASRIDTGYIIIIIMNGIHNVIQIFKIVKNKLTGRSMAFMSVHPTLMIIEVSTSRVFYSHRWQRLLHFPYLAAHMKFNWFLSSHRHLGYLTILVQSRPHNSYHNKSMIQQYAIHCHI